MGKEVRQLQQKWQQREVLLLLAQVLTARGVALQQQFRWLAGNQRQQSSNGTHETRAVQGSFRRARACWGGGQVKMTCAVLRDDMRRNVDVRGLFLLIDPRNNKKGPCFASQGAQTLPLSRGLAQLSKLSEPLFCLCSATNARPPTWSCRHSDSGQRHCKSAMQGWHCNAANWFLVSSSSSSSYKG